MILYCYITIETGDKNKFCMLFNIFLVFSIWNRIVSKVKRKNEN